VRIPFSTALVAAVTLAVSPAALADTTDSANWSGYAAHRPGVTFSKVVAAWRQPGAACTAGHASYSSVWVGLGGYSITANALEQVGTEVDCSLSGTVVSSAWYELVPAPSQLIRMTVHPGDLIEASVSVTGHQVSLRLADATTHRSFVKSLHAARVDVSSAEWIVEAPSDCISTTQCQTLPLANFGAATFNFAAAQSTKRHSGSISDRTWSHTKIVLTPGGRRFVVTPGTGAGSGVATPSDLSLNGTSFTVAYQSAAVSNSRRSASAARVVALGRLVHGLR
jgi:hypothetical protein